MLVLLVLLLKVACSKMLMILCPLLNMVKLRKSLSCRNNCRIYNWPMTCCSRMVVTCSSLTCCRMVVRSSIWIMTLSWSMSWGCSSNSSMSMSCSSVNVSRKLSVLGCKMSRRNWILRSVGYSYVRGLCKCTKESSKLAFDRSNSLVLPRSSCWFTMMNFLVIPFRRVLLRVVLSCKI